MDAENESLPPTTVPSNAECLKWPDKYRWENSKVTFDNVLAGFLTLMQVVGILDEFFFIFNEIFPRKIRAPDLNN